MRDDRSKVKKPPESGLPTGRRGSLKNLSTWSVTSCWRTAEILSVSLGSASVANTFLSNGGPCHEVRGFTRVLQAANSLSPAKVVGRTSVT